MRFVKNLSIFKCIRPGGYKYTACTFKILSNQQPYWELNVTSNTHVLKVSNSFLLDEHFTIAAFYAVRTFWKYVYEWVQNTWFTFSLSLKRGILAPVRWQLIGTFCQSHSVSYCIRWYFWVFLPDTYEVFLFVPAYNKTPLPRELNTGCVLQKLWGNKKVQMPVGLIVKYNFKFSFYR